MNVVHIITDYSMNTGGAQRIVLSLNDCLNDHPHINSSIIGLYRDDNPQPGAISLALSSPYHPLAAWKLYQTLRRVDRETILHVHLFPPLFYISLLRLLGLIKNVAVCTEHNTSNRRRGTLKGYLIDLITYRGYSRVVAISQGVKSKLIEWKPSLASSTRVIYNGIPIETEMTDDRPHEDKLIILSVGRLHTQKNYATAIEAVSKIRNVRFEYWIAGEGQEKEALEHVIEELDLGSQVKLLGHVNNVKDLLTRVHVFLMPSKWEGFGLSLVEALNSGLPAVVSNVEGISEIMGEQEQFGFMVDPQSSEQIAGALQKLLENDELRQRMGRAGHSRSKKFGIDGMVEGYVSLYEEVSCA